MGSLDSPRVSIRCQEAKRAASKDEACQALSLFGRVLEAKISTTRQGSKSPRRLMGDRRMINWGSFGLPVLTGTQIGKVHQGGWGQSTRNMEFFRDLEGSGRKKTKGFGALLGICGSRQVSHSQMVDSYPQSGNYSHSILAGKLPATPNNKTSSHQQFTSNNLDASTY